MYVAVTDRVCDLELVTVITTAYLLPDVVRLDTIPDMVSQMIGYNLKTKQTPPDGVTVNKVSNNRLLYK